MVASKENNIPACSSSSTSSAHRHYSSSTLRSPLSPIHHNGSCARPPELHPTLSHRRPAANPSRAPLPPYGVKSPPLPTHLVRNPALPRSPKPSTINARRLLKDGVPVDLAPRFKTHKEKDLTPAASTPRRNSSLQLCNPPKAKRQTQLFVQQKASLEPLLADKAGSCNQTWMEHTESAKNEKPCRKKWRRYPRESVLRSLRGGDAQGSPFGLAATDMERLSQTTNPCYDAETSPKKVEAPVPEPALSVKGESFRQLSFNVYADGTFSTCNQASECAHPKREEEKQEISASFTCETETFDGSMGVPSGDKTIFSSMPVPGSPSATHVERDSLVLTPPPGRSLSLTPQAERSLTPPMQPTQSPDFIKREGVRTLLPINGTCYAVPCAFVKDRRKCKPRGVLTVDTGQEMLSSAESELGYVLQRSTQQMPIPAVASVEWMVDKNKNLGDANSPELVSASTDLCRMSLPKLSPAQNGLFFEQITEFRASEDLEDGCKSNQGSLQHGSFSISGYEWTMSSSQDMLLSTRCTEVNSANPRRSIIFDNNEDVDRSQCDSTKFKSTIMHNILFEDVPEVCNPSTDSSDEESGDCLHVEEISPLEGSPPFEYSLLGSLKTMEPAKIKQRSWSEGFPEEVMLSMSGPTVSPLSSQEHDTDEKCALVSALCTNAGPLVIKGGGRNFKGDCRPYDTGPQVGNDIPSRLAMAKFLCKITATYLDDIATCLGKAKADVELERSPSKGIIENAENISLEHSSLLAGRKKMVECCSLLRGLTLETSKSGETNSRASECSVNQPSPSANEDTADSLQALVRRSRRRSRRFPEQMSLLSDELREYFVESPHECSLLGNSQPSAKVTMPAAKAEVEAWLPSKGLIAGSYLLAGLFVISRTCNKHVKRAEQVI